MGGQTGMLSKTVEVLLQQICNMKATVSSPGSAFFTFVALFEVGTHFFSVQN